MSLRPYSKSAITFANQVIRLEDKGMVFDNKIAAEKKLASINYYRLSGYWYPFRIRNANDEVTNQFEAGTNFSKVIEIYEFDRRLRFLVLDAIERVEIAVRTQFTYHIGCQYGAFGHTNKANFHRKFQHGIWISHIEKEIDRSSDVFIQHFKSKYTGFPTIPVWMLTEVISLGSLSRGYKGLKNDSASGIGDKKIIAQHFDVHHKKLEDWLHTLSYIRNICAHHGRLWNRNLVIRPGRTKERNWIPPITPRQDRLFFILLILRHLLRATGNGDDWAQAINRLLEPLASETRWRAAMGLPKDWKTHPVWR